LAGCGAAEVVQREQSEQNSCHSISHAECAGETAAWREMSVFAGAAGGGQIRFLEAEALWRMCGGIKAGCQVCSALGVVGGTVIGL